MEDTGNDNDTFVFEHCILVRVCRGIYMVRSNMWHIL